MKEIHNFTIIGRKQHGPQYFSLTLQHTGSMQHIEPGQFVEVLIEGCREVMLRRPISVHDVDEKTNTLSLLVQIVGNGTRQLGSLKIGDSLNIVYPLGHGFTVEASGQRPLLVGGGAGIAPLLYLSKALADMNVRPTVLLGGRTADLIPVQDEFLPYAEVLIATNDGSRGHHGVVTTHPAFTQSYSMIYTCGPTPMMKAVARSAAERGLRCEVSLENMMACGVGACLCCVTETDQGHRCVCKDGPVFDIKVMEKWYLQ